ncbi:hypothetical protein OPT61_g1704 [Boeremia exigua]|uniref:Uncharacterized protein n=1 Tax=Boeremia exigua TaxID=749465 RepID=A0ACC2IP33_9PLEO|nr:hypothetical protein OPT61_g1704 [Boeremia exigua]
MTAYSATVDTHHGAQSLQRASSDIVATQARVDLAPRTAVLSSGALSQTRDCRWKRGRPLIFSSRTFGTKQASLNTQACTVVAQPAAPGTAGQTPEKVVIPPSRSHQHMEETGDTATPGEHEICEEHEILHSSLSAPQQTDHAIDISTSSKTGMGNALASLTDTHDVGREDRTARRPELELNMQLGSLNESTTDEVAETDYTPSSSDQSDGNLEKDNVEAEDAEAEDARAEDAQEENIETHEPLQYQIPEEVLRAAMGAPENTKASFWSSNLYRGPEDKKILVHYCKTKELSERVAQHFVGETVVGFDIEWKPWAHALSVKHNVSLIQLACENRIALFHIAQFSGSTAAQIMPPTLKTILESPDVYKVGVAVKADLSRVAKYLDVEPQGVFELSRLHNLVQYSVTDPSKVTKKVVSLATQVQQHLKLPLYKGGDLVDDPEDTSNVRSSDWSLPLNNQQIHYAAADAYAGFRLYDVLEEKRKKLKPTPPRPLVCDYDSKPKPRSSDSKPRKRRTANTKTNGAVSAVAESSSPTEHAQEREEDTEEEPKQSQDTEEYETAQEDLVDGHQLEGEYSASSGESYGPTDEGDDDDGLVDSAHLQVKKETATQADTNQRRVGRINLSWLKGPDPGYPVLPEPPISEDSYISSDGDLVDTSIPSHDGKPSETSDGNGDTDDFDDPELEEAMHRLTIDSDGVLREASESASIVSTPAPPERSDLSAGKMEANPNASEGKTEDNSTDEEQHLIDLLNDPEVAVYLHASTQPPVSPHVAPPSADTPTAPSNASLHTPEYNLATSWAQTYLASTIPSPASRAPSHIRATIPHLRAYNMWRHQGLSLGEIARHLRDPPLLESTVGSYVLQAITLEKMEYEEEEVKKVLMDMPAALRRGKWKRLAEKVGAK